MDTEDKGRAMESKMIKGNSDQKSTHLICGRKKAHIWTYPSEISEYQTNKNRGNKKIHYTNTHNNQVCIRLLSCNTKHQEAVEKSLEATAF